MYLFKKSYLKVNCYYCQCFFSSNVFRNPFRVIFCRFLPGPYANQPNGSKNTNLWMSTLDFLMHNFPFVRICHFWICICRYLSNTKWEISHSFLTKFRLSEDILFLNPFAFRRFEHSNSLHFNWTYIELVMVCFTSDLKRDEVFQNDN